MSIFVTTQSYRKETPTTFGLLLKMNENTGEIIKQKRIETPVQLAEKAGRIKPGLRGVFHYQDKLYTCSWGSIFVLNDKTLELEAEISHKWMSDLHGIYVDEDGIWATSSLPDALLLVGFDGKVHNAFWTSESGLYPEKIEPDKEVDWRLIGKDFLGFKTFHANHVEVNGKYVFLTGRGKGNNNGLVIKFPKDEFLRGKQSEEIEYSYHAENLHGPHDGIWDQDLLWVTETTSSTIAAINGNGNVTLRKKIRESEEEEITYDSLKDFIKVNFNRIFRKHGGKRITHWTRGLCITDHHLYVGQSTWAGEENSKARIVKVNKATNAIEDCFYLDIPDYPETRIFQIIQVND